MLVSNKSKILKIIVGIILILHIFSIKTFAMVKPTSNFYVNDYAHLLDSSTKNYIISTNQDLCRKTGAQIVVVTVPNLEGNSLEEYATKLFRNFGIGDKTKNNGVLLLLALEERQIRVEVGYGLEGCLNDAKTGRIQDEYIIPYLKNNNWNEGIRNGFNAILEEVSNEYGVSIEGAEVVEQANIEENDGRIVFWTIMMGISAVLGLFAWRYKKIFFVLILYVGAFFYIKYKGDILNICGMIMTIGAFFYGLMGLGIGGSYEGGGFSGGGGSSSGGGGSSGGGRKF